MPAATRAIELRARAKENVADPNTTTYKVYTYGRLRGAIVPMPEDEHGNRWTALDLAGVTTLWRYRNQARDHLVGLP